LNTRYVRYIGEKIPSGFQQQLAFAQEIDRLCHMLQYVPQRDGVEGTIIKRCLLQCRAEYLAFSSHSCHSTGGKFLRRLDPCHLKTIAQTDL